MICGSVQSPYTACLIRVMASQGRRIRNHVQSHGLLGQPSAGVLQQLTTRKYPGAVCKALLQGLMSRYFKSSWLGPTFMTL